MGEGGDSQGRVAVVTGASSGIGLAAAKALASQGWRIIAQGRDPDRCAAAEAAIRAAGPPGARVDMIRADLSLLKEAARLADEVANLTYRVDVLINNAGGTSSGRRMTSEGHEATFAANHLGPFLLTQRLLPLLHVAAAGVRPGATRIINVSSSAHEHTPGLDWNDLQSIEDFDPAIAYCNAKLANVLFTRELSKRLSGGGVVAHAMHPGAVDTNFFSYGDDSMKAFALANDLITAEAGADTIVWLALDAAPGESTGVYWHLRRPIPTSAFAQDREAAVTLWRESERLIATWTQNLGGLKSG